VTGDRVTSQLVRFVIIGVVSTVIHTVTYLLLREWLTPALANLVALTLATVLNTEANLRLTFTGTRGSIGRIHCQSFVLFGMYYAITSGAVLILHEIVRQPTRSLELAILLAAMAIGTMLRFTALRRWVFK
jgi:putative flippase GtrA